MRQPAFALLVVLALGSCGFEKKEAHVRTVESNLAAAGFRTINADTAQKRSALRGLPVRRLTEKESNGKRYYWYADADGCGCAYVGGEAAYRRYDALAQQRDERASDKADARMLRTVESVEDTPGDAWFWQDVAPELFPR
jgi:hypothetical protein